MNREELFQKPVVVFDGSCGLCTGGTKWLLCLDWLHRFDLVPYQDERLYSNFPEIKLSDYEKALYVIFPNRKSYSGADAFREIFLRMPLTFVAGMLMLIPPLPWILRKLYPILARNRYRLGGRCEIRR